MCYECCKQLKGWCKSFTRTEIILTLLQLLLLIIFFAFLVFLVLHFLICEDSLRSYNTSTNLVKQIPISSIENSNSTTYSTTKKEISTTRKTTSQYRKSTFNKTLECTWSPSHKTNAQTRFIEILSISYKIDITTAIDRVFKSTAPYFEYVDDNGEVKNTSKQFDNDNEIISDKSGFISKNVDLFKNVEDISSESDGEEVGNEEGTVVLALVKVKPPTDVIFGCILTIVTQHWTLTAASCIESIEEMDTLDAFVMMEDYGSVKKGRTHTVSDVQIHPFYEGVNRSYDLAALKTDSNLLRRCRQVELPSMLDQFMITIGEIFHILGYGPFRTIDKGPNGKRLRKVTVYSLPSKQCPEDSESGAGAGAGALRYLWGGSAVRRAACGAGAGALCAGVRYARGVACNYCGGSPLLSGSLLYGLMSESKQCGLACEPQLYVTIALVNDWLYSVIENK